MASGDKWQPRCICIPLTDCLAIQLTLLPESVPIYNTIISVLQVFTICTDLVFTLFICPAIVKPEPHGITDVPVGSVASFNLIQVAQILQMLALRKYEPIDPRLADLYDQFDKVSSKLIWKVSSEGIAVLAAKDVHIFYLVMGYASLFIYYYFYSFLKRMTLTYR